MTCLVSARKAAQYEVDCPPQLIVRGNVRPVSVGGMSQAAVVVGAWPLLASLSILLMSGTVTVLAVSLPTRLLRYSKFVGERYAIKTN